MSAVTAITAQNDERFYSMNPIPSTLLREQLRSVVTRYRPSVVKIGMLGTEENVMGVCRFLDSEGITQVVLDPVLKSTTGAVLLVPKGIAILREFLIPRATVVTPNIPEVEVLTGLPASNVDEMKEAALRLHRACRGVKTVLVKGGHLENEATDVLYDGSDFHLFVSRTRFAKRVHGTGCVYSAALASYLARGETIPEATRQAKQYVTAWIRKHNEPDGT